MARIPFTLPDDGFNERKGTVSVEDGYVVIRLETSFMGEWNRQEQMFKIEPASLEDAELRTGVFKDTLAIVPKNQALFEDLPGFLEGEVALKIKRKHRDQCRALVDDVQREIVGF